MALLWLIVAVQLVLGVRVLVRMARSARGTRIDVTTVEHTTPAAISVIVPVLDEVARLTPCLEGLLAADAAVREILVVDGGSRDGTQALVASYAARDPRIRLIDAAPVPEDWNGKAWGLEVGLQASDAASTWIATLDADVQPTPHLHAAMVAKAEREGIDALSVATMQALPDDESGLLHPAMLTTLVYRCGLPGHAAARIEDVQANGQCFLARRDVLVATDVFRLARASVCEDVTAARALVRAGHRVGFYEAGDAVVVRMYENWRETWENWPRSLTLRDSLAPRLAALGLAEVVFVQALPMPLVLVLLLSGAAGAAGHAMLDLNVVLLMMRLGVLAGTARAYRKPPDTYWLSPLADLPVAVALLVSALSRQHTWRGRTLVSSGRSF